MGVELATVRPRCFCANDFLKPEMHTVCSVRRGVRRDVEGEGRKKARRGERSRRGVMARTGLGLWVRAVRSERGRGKMRV